jgi:hypothetical protein
MDSIPSIHKVKLVGEEKDWTYEQLALSWNRRSAEMGRVDRWNVIDGKFVKVNWPSKKPDEPNYEYLVIDGELYHPRDEG